MDVPSFDLPNLDGDLLLELVKRCREHLEVAFREGRPMAAIEALMNAASEELYRRRQSGMPATGWQGANKV